MVYPKRNRRLLEDVRDFGCLISEYPPGKEPAAWHFPVRNRIISGLCRGVVVAEAPQKSGSLITARLAAEQGRDVFAIPGSAGEPLCAGSNDLLRQGASFAETAEDVIQDYLYLFPEQVHSLTEEEKAGFEREFSRDISVESEEIPEEKPKKRSGPDKKDVDKPENRTYIDVHEALRGLSPEESAVLMTLADGPKQTDRIIYESGLTAAVAVGHLTMLQIRGLIQALPGGSYSLKEL